MVWMLSSPKDPYIKTFPPEQQYWEVLWPFKRWGLVRAHYITEAVPLMGMWDHILLSLVQDVTIFSYMCSCCDVLSSPTLTRSQTSGTHLILVFGPSKL